MLGSVNVENFAHVLGDEPRFTVVYDGAHRAFIEPEFGWQADDVVGSRPDPLLT